MSIVNAFVMRDVALIGVDTESRFPDGSTAESCKVLFLPHLSAAVAFRGIDVAHAVATVQILSFAGGFDELAGAMPEIVKQSVAVARDKAEHLFGVKAEYAEASNFVLVGFSHAGKRMMGHSFVTAPGSPDVEVTQDFPQVISPFWSQDDITRLNIRTDKAGMRALALEQCRLARERGPSDFPAGGRLFISEIRQGSITTEEVCRFPPR